MSCILSQRHALSMCGCGRGADGEAPPRGMHKMCGPRGGLWSGYADGDERREWATVAIYAALI